MKGEGWGWVGMRWEVGAADGVKIMPLIIKAPRRSAAIARADFGARKAMRIGCGGAWGGNRSEETHSPLPVDDAVAAILLKCMFVLRVARSVS